MDMSSTTPELGEVITSKDMMLVFINTGQPVRVNYLLELGGNELFVIGATAPVYDGAPGRVYLKGVQHRRKSEVRPNEIGMAWRAL